MFRDGDGDGVLGVDDARAVVAEDAHAERVAMRLAEAAVRAKMRMMRTTTTASPTAPTTTTTGAPTTSPTPTLPTVRSRRKSSASLDASVAALAAERRARADAERVAARLATRLRRRDAEAAKLRDALRVARSKIGGASTSNRARPRDATPAPTASDGTPETVSFEYHVAATEAFERKVRALAREIEDLRRSKGSRDDASDPATPDEPSTPRPGRGRAVASPADDDTDTESESDAPFSPTMSPLDALLARIARIDRHARVVTPT